MVEPPLRRSRPRGRAARRGARPRRARARGRWRPSPPGGARRGRRPPRLRRALRPTPSRGRRSRCRRRGRARGAVEPAVRRDHGRRVGHRDARGRPPRRRRRRQVRHARSSAGITQVRFCGSAARQPPSQPGCPSSPVRSPYRSRADGPGDGRHRPSAGVARLTRQTTADDLEAAPADARLALLDVEPTRRARRKARGRARRRAPRPPRRPLPPRPRRPRRGGSAPSRRRRAPSRAGARSRGTTRPAPGRGRRRCGGRSASAEYRGCGVAWSRRGPRRRACECPDREHVQPVRRGAQGAAPPSPPRGVPLRALGGADPARRRGARLPRRPRLRPPVHVGAAAHRRRAGGGDGDDRPARPRRARARRRRAALERRPDPPGHRDEQSRADPAEVRSGLRVRRAARRGPARHRRRPRRRGGALGGRTSVTRSHGGATAASQRGLGQARRAGGPSERPSQAATLRRRRSPDRRLSER